MNMRTWGHDDHDEDEDIDDIEDGDHDDNEGPLPQSQGQCQEDL